MADEGDHIYAEDNEELYMAAQQFLIDEGILEDEDEDEDEDEEEGEDYEEDDDVVELISLVTSPRVSQPGPEENGDSQRTEGGGVSSSNGKVGSQENGEEWNRSEVDGLFCPICMEAWTNGGDHQIWLDTPTIC